MKPAITAPLVMLLAVLLLQQPTWSAQTQTRLKQVMRTKLDHSQQIFGAVVTSNWYELERHSQALGQVSQDLTWSSILGRPEYRRYTEAFLRATDDLTQAARARDLEAASLGFISLSTSCVSCHRYIARSRVVGTR